MLNLPSDGNSLSHLGPPMDLEEAPAFQHQVKPPVNLGASSSLRNQLISIFAAPAEASAGPHPPTLSTRGPSCLAQKNRDKSVLDTMQAARVPGKCRRIRSNRGSSQTWLAAQLTRYFKWGELHANRVWLPVRKLFIRPDSCLSRRAKLLLEVAEASNLRQESKNADNLRFKSRGRYQFRADETDSDSVLEAL
jgi:hypothetical protein